jgi:hypothetical protein
LILSQGTFLCIIERDTVTDAVAACMLGRREQQQQQ